MCSSLGAGEGEAGAGAGGSVSAGSSVGESPDFSVKMDFSFLMLWVGAIPVSLAKLKITFDNLHAFKLHLEPEKSIKT